MALQAALHTDEIKNLSYKQLMYAVGFDDYQENFFVSATTKVKQTPVNAALALKQISEELGDKHYFNLQETRYNWILNAVLKEVPAGGKVADIGAAPGHLSMALSDIGYSVTAFDFAPDADMWEAAEDGSFRASLSRHDVALKHWDVEVTEPAEVQPSAFAGQFDCVIFTEVMEHVYRYPFATVRQIASLLKAGGVIILTTPNRASLTSRIKALFGKPIDTSIDCLMDCFPPHMRHVWVYTPSEVEYVLREVGFKTARTEVISFHLWTTKISQREILPYWKPTNLKQLLKPALACVLKVIPSFGETICTVARK